MTLLLSGCAVPRPESLLDRATICAAIGRVGAEEELCAFNIVNHSPYYEAARVYLVSDSDMREIQALGGIGIYELLASPSRKYLAMVENAGEGHPELSVCSLEDVLRGEREPPCFAGFNPYPGGVYDLEWQGDVLTFSSEAPDQILLESAGGEYWHYALDAKTGKVEKTGASPPRLD